MLNVASENMYKKKQQVEHLSDLKINDSLKTLKVDIAQIFYRLYLQILQA